MPKSGQWILAVLFCGKALCCDAQDAVDFQLWSNYALTVPIKSTPRFTYGGDVGIRGLVSNQDWNQFLIRPSARWRFNQIWSVSAAVANFTTLNENKANVYEYRMHQEVNAKWPDLGLIELFYRLRIEQRWFFYPDAPDDYKNRFRYLVGFETMDFRLGEGRRPFYFKVMWEGFNTFSDEEAVELFLNNARLDGSFGHRISDSFRYELHFFSQRSGCW